MKSKTETNCISNVVLERLKQKRLQTMDEDEKTDQFEVQKRYEEFSLLWETIKEQLKNNKEYSTFMDYLVHYNDPRLLELVQQISFLCYHEGHEKGYIEGVDSMIDD